MDIIKELNDTCRSTLVATLGIKFTAVGEGWLEATMPVDHRTVRPDGVLHGGANMALAETVGGALSFISVDMDKYDVFGIEINGNHMKNAKGAWVTARGNFIHKGHRTQVVSVEIKDEFGTVVSICRNTNIVIEKRPLL